MGQTSNCLVDSICRRLRCDLGPETSTNTAHQLQGELAIPVPEYGHPHATNNGACSRDAPGPTNSLPLHPRIGTAERRPHRCSGHQHGSDGGLANASQAWRARARTTRHARTCPPCPCAHNTARPHLQQCDRGVDGPGAGDDGPPAAGEGGHVACAPAAGRVSDLSTEAQVPQTCFSRLMQLLHSTTFLNILYCPRL